MQKVKNVTKSMLTDFLEPDWVLPHLFVLRGKTVVPSHHDREHLLKMT